MSKYIPSSQRPKSPHKTCPKSQPKIYPKIERNTYKSTSQKSHFRRLTSKTLTYLNDEIKENLKYNQYVNEKLFGPTFKLSPPKKIPTKDNYIDTESKNVEIHCEAIPKTKTIPNSNNNIDNNPNDMPTNSYPNTTRNPQKIGENNKITRGKHNMGKILSTSKSHLKIKYGKSGDTILVYAATSKTISNKNDEKKTHVTISISTTSKTLPYDNNKINDTNKNISHQIDEKINIKYATLIPKDYAHLRAYTHIINAPISTPITIIETETPGTLPTSSNTPITPSQTIQNDDNNIKIKISSTNIHVMGFTPPMKYNDKFHKIVLARQIKEDTGWNFASGSIHYIIGNVWNNLTNNFEPGPGANLIISGIITQDDINNINHEYSADRKCNASDLVFVLGHKNKWDYINNGWYSNDIENAIEFDRFTVPQSLLNTQNCQHNQFQTITTLPTTSQHILQARYRKLDRTGIDHLGKTKQHKPNDKTFTGTISEDNESFETYQIPPKRNELYINNKNDISSSNHIVNQLENSTLNVININQTLHDKKNNKETKIVEVKSIDLYDGITPTPSSNTPKQSLAAISHLKIENINEDAIKIGGTLTASSQNHTSHKNIDDKSIKSITPITHPLLPINYNLSINMNKELSVTLTANKYLLNGKNPNVMNGTLVLLIICKILLVQYTSRIYINNINI